MVLRAMVLVPLDPLGALYPCHLPSQGATGKHMSGSTVTVGGTLGYPGGMGQVFAGSSKQNTCGDTVSPTGLVKRRIQFRVCGGLVIYDLSCKTRAPSPVLTAAKWPGEAAWGCKLSPWIPVSDLFRFLSL